MENKSEQLLIEGNELFDNQKFDEALTKYKAALAQDPEYLDALNNYGLTLSRQNKIDEAIEAYKKVISLDPNYIAAYRNIGLAYSQINEPYKSIKYFSDALNIAPDNYEILNDYGNVLLDLKEYDQAIDKYKAASQIKQDFVYSIYNQGVAFEKKEDLKEAVRFYNMAIQSNPDYINSYLNLAQIYVKQNKMSKAAHFYKKIISKFPSSDKAHLNYARVLYKLSRYEEAVHEHIVAIKHNPSDGFYPDELADAMIKLKNRRKLLAEIQTMVSDSNNSDVLNKMGNLYYYLDMFEDAIDQYKKTISIQNDYIYAHHNWGLALNRLHKYSEAIQHFNDAFKIDTNYVESVRNLAESYFKSGDFEKAIDTYKRTITLDPDNNFAYIDLAASFYKAGKEKEAVNQFLEAIEKSPREALVNQELNNLLENIKNQEQVFSDIQYIIDNHNKADIYNDWGNIFFYLCKYDRAIEQYNKSVKLDSEFVYAYHNLGLSYFNLKQYNLAIEQYKLAIKVDMTYASTFYNYAFLLDRIGEYGKAKELWEKAAEVYKSSTAAAMDNKTTEHFYYYGDIIHSILGDYEKAEQIYKDGLSLDENYVPILVNLVSLYMDIKENSSGRNEESASAKTNAHWKAWEYYRKTEKLIQEGLQKNESFNSLLDAGDLYLIMAENEKAIEMFLKAAEINKTSSRVYLKLGNTYARIGDYKKAVRYLQLALEQDDDNLLLQSSIADVYLKTESIESAEAIYKRILEVTPNNIEAHIGLGEINTINADKEDSDLYPEAVACFTRALNISLSDKSSKKLKKKEIAAIYYSRGYARVKMYESLKLTRDDNILKLAQEDFKRCYANDPDNHKAKRAQERIERSFTLKPARWLSEKFGPAVVFTFSFLCLLFAQYLYFVGKPVFGEKDFSISNSVVQSLSVNLSAETLKNLEQLQMKKYPETNLLIEKMKGIIGNEAFEKYKPEILTGITSETGIKSYQPIESGYYVLLTFGSLIFMVTGLYLPQVLKLKVGGIELEKSAVDQMKSSVTLGISKGTVDQTRANISIGISKVI